MKTILYKFAAIRHNGMTSCCSIDIEDDVIVWKVERIEYVSNTIYVRTINKLGKCILLAQELKIFLDNKQIEPIKYREMETHIDYYDIWNVVKE